MVTRASAIAAPDGSVTVPDSVAPATCARAWLAERIAMVKTTNTAMILCEKILCSMSVPPDDRFGLIFHGVPAVRSPGAATPLALIDETRVHTSQGPASGSRRFVQVFVSLE